MDAYQLTSSDHQTCSCPQALFSLVFGYSAVLRVRSVLLSIPDCSILYLDKNSHTNWYSNVLKVARNYLNIENSGLLGCDIELMVKWLLTLERDIHSGFISGVKQSNKVLLRSYWMIAASPLDRWQQRSEQYQWQHKSEMWCCEAAASYTVPIMPFHEDTTGQRTSFPDPWRWKHYIHSQHRELLIQQHSVIITRSSESSTKPLRKLQILHREHPFPSEKSTKNYILINNTATSLSSWWLHTSLTL
jgi:hypothetical protein